MVQIFADVLVINSMLELEESPNYDERLDSVLTHHTVDREIFAATLDYYQQDPHRWKDLINRVVTELETRRDAAQEDSSNRSSS